MLSMKQFILLSIALFVLVGCATTEQENTEARKNSTLPWAKPASWEGGLPGLR